MMPGIIAAGLDWLEGLLPLLFVGFWILSQVMAVFRRVKGKGPGPVVVVRPAAPDRAEREQLEQQIEQFLRDAGSRRLQPNPDNASGPAAASQPKPRFRERPPLPPQQPVATPPSPLVGLERRDSEVARHVHDVFGHELAHLQSPLARRSIEPQKQAALTTAAAQMAELVRNPQTIRQVILLREVLERPTDRW